MALSIWPRQSVLLASFEKVTSVPATTLCSALQAVAFESIEISTAAVVAAASNLKTMGVQSGPLQAGDPLEPQQYVLPGLLQGEQRRLLQESTHRERSLSKLDLYLAARARRRRRRRCRWQRRRCNELLHIQQPARPLEQLLVTGQRAERGALQIAEQQSAQHSGSTAARAGSHSAHRQQAASTVRAGMC